MVGRMLMLRKVLPLVFSVAALLVSGCNEQEVIHDMARFDRAYVPALVLTVTRDTTGQSVLAVKRLRQDWELLSAKYRQLFAGGDGADKVDGIIERADLLVTTGDFEGAHRELESIRGILQDARKSRGIDYFMDYLTPFHSAMEKVVSAVDGKEPKDITRLDVSVIEKMLPEAKARWRAVSAAPFDRKPFLFDKETEKALMEAIAAEAKAIGYLEAAVRSGNRKLIAKHAEMMKKGYYRVFRMFGNFDSVSI